MIKFNKRKANIIGATGMAIFSLGSVFAGTYAWFAMNTEVGASGMSVRLNNESNQLSILTIHKCNLAASTDSKLVFYETPACTVSASGINYGEAPTMDNYSDLNQTQPMLLLFGFNSGVNEQSVTIRAKSDNDSYVSTITSQNISHFPFSTTVIFKSASFTDTTFPFSNVPKSSLTQETSFVTITNYTYSGYTSNINLFTGSADRTITYVAVIMDYYPEAREVLLTNNVGVDILALDNNNAIDFYCDWILEV